MNETAENTQSGFDLGSVKLLRRRGQFYGVDGRPLALRAKSARLLQVLLENPGSVVSKDTLAKSVWPDTIATDENISRCISDIRKAIADDSHSVLETFPKRGYLIHATPINPSGLQRRVFLPPRPAWVVTLALVLVAVFYWNAKPSTAVVPDQRQSIAVLPFADVSGDYESDYLSSALAGELAADLSQLSVFRVLSQRLSNAHVGSLDKPTELASELGVRYLVYGTIGHEQDEFEIAAELVDGRDGSRLWQETFHGGEEALLRFSNDFLRNLTARLPLALGEHDQRRLNAPDTNSASAFVSVLLGRRAFSTFIYEENLQAEMHFRRAVELDPGYARAYAELTSSIVARLENDWVLLERADVERALYYARKAIELDPELWFAYFALGRILSVQSEFSDLQAATENLQKAMSLNPASDDARVYYAVTKILQGHPKEAITLLEATLASNPNPPFWYYLGYSHALFQAKRYEEAAESLSRCLHQMPNAPYCLRFQIANFAQLDQLDDAKWAVEEYQALGFDASISSLLHIIQDNTPEQRMHLENAYRKVGLPE